jgi:hypothetical protein
MSPIVRSLSATVLDDLRLCMATLTPAETTAQMSRVPPGKARKLGTARCESCLPERRREGPLSGFESRLSTDG